MANSQTGSQITNGFGPFCVELQSYLDSPKVLKLATFFEFTESEMGELQNSPTPDIDMVRKMNSKGIISSEDISKLIDALGAMKLEGTIKKVQTSFDRNMKRTGHDDKYVQTEREAIQSPSPILVVREHYPYLSDKMYEKYKTNEPKLCSRNEESEEDCKEMLDRYTLRDNKDCESQNWTHGEDELRVVLIGKAGVGKSSTANTLLGKAEFVESNSAEPETENLCLATCKLSGGQELCVVDSPGMKCKKQSETDILKEIGRVAVMLRRGVHVFILVWNASEVRFTDEAKDMLKSLEGEFQNFKSHCLLVYTHAESKLTSKSLDEYIDDLKRTNEMRTFLDALGWRVVALNNITDIPAEKARNQKTLIAMLNKIVATNGDNSVYTNMMFQEASKLFEKMVRKCGESCHPALVSSVVQAYDCFSYFYLLKNYEKTFLVFNRLKHSNTGRQVSTGSWELRDGAATTILATDECNKQIIFVADELDSLLSKFLKYVFEISPPVLKLYFYPELFTTIIEHGAF